jgi:uncharacterized protein YgiM (DUF1202 family)
MEFYLNSPKRAEQRISRHASAGAHKLPELHMVFRCLIAVLLLVTLAGFCSAQPPSVLSDEPGGGESASTDVNTMDASSFPYVAEITGNDVNIRSGAGTNYYRCGKLYKGDQVTVVSDQLGWSRIVPPSGCFSWISVQYVCLNRDNPAMGIVTGDKVRVYAGSEYVDPMHSTSVQVTLKRGDKVQLLGEERKNYYKIVPPKGAYLWVSSQYTKPVVPAQTTPPEPIITAPNEPVSPNSVDVSAPNAPVEPVATNPIESKKLQEYYELREKVQAEREKPSDQQNYKELKEALKQIADNKDAGKAARYAEFVLEQIKRYELAVQVAKQIEQQNEQLQRTTETIDQARNEKLASIKELGKFAVIGEFQAFAVYGPGHYKILNDSGKTVCYAVPAADASTKNLTELIGKKVGLVGTLEPHPPTKRVRVRFTDIVELSTNSR